MSVILLTKTGIQHVQSHSVTLFGTSDSDQSLIAIVLGLVDLDDASTDLANFVDLLSTLTNDGTDHIVRNVNLLSHGSTGHTGTTVHGLLALRSSMGLRAGDMTTLVRGHVRSSTVTTGSLRGIVQRCAGSGLGYSAVVRGLLLRIRIRRQVVVRSRIGTSAIVLSLSKVASGWLGAVRDYLHAARYNTCRATTAGCVCRRCRSAEALIELIQERASDIVGGNVYCISHTHDY